MCDQIHLAHQLHNSTTVIVDTVDGSIVIQQFMSLIDWLTDWLIDWLIDWLTGFYVPFQFNYGSVESDDDSDDDKTEICPPSQGQGFIRIPPT